MFTRRALPSVVLLALVTIASGCCSCGGCGSCGGNGETSAAADAAATGSSLSGAPGATTSASTAVASTKPPTATPAELAAWAACAEQRKKLLEQPELEGAADYERQRLLFAGVRGRTQLWRRAPKPASDILAQRLAKNDKPLAAVRGAIRKYRSLEQRRKVLLREGYLWSDDPVVALALVEQVGLTHLFDDKQLHLQRGADSYTLERVKRTRYLPERYLYVDGPRAGESAEILHGNRVAADRADLGSPLGIDLDVAQQHGKFDRLKPVRLTEQALVAELRYGPGTWVPAIMALEGARANVQCEVLTAELAARKQSFHSDSELRRRALLRLHEVVFAMVREEIPFDADADQENGFMRRGWKRAYFNGWRRFTLRDKKYDVYSPDGQPIPPQVCIDFLIDTWERAAGKWYLPLEGDPPEPKPGMTEGPIDFSELGLRNRRSVAKFVKLAKKHPELFEVWDVPKDEWIAFKDREPFFRHLADKADEIREGDMLIIKGYKEGGRPHYHSLVVLRKDPVTGVPVLVAGNAVKPRAQTLEGVMQISPKRSIRHRIRLLEPWLSHVAAKAPEP